LLITFVQAVKTVIYWGALKRIERDMVLSSHKVRRLAGVAGLSASLLLTGLLASADAAAQKLYYRYKNEQGITVQTDRLPPAVVRQGYQIVSASGDVLKVVPRELTADERKARDAQNAENQRGLAEQERIRKWDRSLVLRYSNVDEIDAAKRRGLKEFDTRIGILQGNLMSLKGQIESEQGDAANYARRGKAVPEDLEKRIKELKSEVLYAESATNQLERERIGTERQYELDRERFEFLLDQAALRR
jgi:hypothetical protein